MYFPILSVTLLTPLLGALTVLLIPGKRRRAVCWVGVGAALMSLFLVTLAWSQTAAGAGAMQFVEVYRWMPALDLTYTVGIDGLSAPLVTLTALLTTLVLFYGAFSVASRVKFYTITILFLEAAVLGALLSLDLLLFYVFLQLALVPAFLLITIWGGALGRRAALKFMLMMLVGSLLFLLGILAIYQETGTFDILRAAAARPFADNLPWATGIFWVLATSFAIQMPILPFHTWLPDAHTAAPVGGSVLLAGVLLKLGGYGMMRILLPLFPGRFYAYSVETPILTGLALVTIIYGSLVCMAQWDLKRLAAYVSVAQMGWVLLGLAVGGGGVRDAEAALAGISGAALQQVAHGIVIAALFFLIGILHARAATHDLKAFGGLGRIVPTYAGLMSVTALALLGLPGLIGFWGLFSILRAAVVVFPAAAVMGVGGMALTAGYVLWKLVQRLLWGPLDRVRWTGLADLTWWEQATVWPLVLLMAGLGVYPAPLIDVSGAAVVALLQALVVP